jgi:AsmA protein
LGFRLLRLVAIGIVVSAALLAAFPPSGVIKDQIAKSVGAAIGRKVTIGTGHFKIWWPLEAELGAIAVANPEGMPARDVFRAETIKATVELLPLIKGRVKLLDLHVVKPEVALEEDAAGTRNWVFTPAPTAAAAPAASSGSGVPFAPVTTIEQGTLTFQSAKTGAQRSASDIDATVSLDAVGGGLTTKGKLVASGETVAFDVAIGDYDAAIAGQSSTLKALIDGRQLRAEVDGDALFSAAAEFKGNLAASSPSLLDLLKWLGADLQPSGEPLKTSLAGKVVSTTRDVTFADTDVMINTTSGRFNGVLDLGNVRPKLSGALASEHVDLSRVANAARRATLGPEAAAEGVDLLVSSGWQALQDDLTALEAGPAPQGESGAQALVQPEAAAARAGWSEQPFNLKAFKAVDLDLDITAKEIAYGALDLKNGRVKAEVTDGLVDAKLEQLAVGDGTATGTLALDSGATPPKANMALSLANVAAEPIITEISGKPLITGTSNVEITAAATGQNQSQLMATLEGKARFLMGKGAVRGFDVRRMVTEWWKSWKFDLAMKTAFEKLEAQYDIKKGVAKSQPDLSIGGGDVEIDAVGSVNVATKRLNQEIRIKVVPPPTALPVPVRISGDWTKPSIGIDWNGLFGFSAAPSLGAGPEAASAPLSETSAIGSPQGVAAAPEAPPANVQATIRRVLAGDIPPDRLTPEARAILQSLLPTEPAP